MSRPPRLTQTFLLCLAILPAYLIFLLIIKYGVDFPWGDEWVLASFLTKYAEGTLTAGDLFAQQFEYRQFFPNLILLGLGWYTRWDVRYEMIFSLALACVVSFNVYRLGKLTIEDRTHQLTAYFISNLMIFSPMQYGNWLMGQQLIYFIPVVCITTCLLVAYSGLGTWAKFAICMCLATASTFSSANGILCWVVVLPVLVWSKTRGDFEKVKWPLMVWVAGLALNAFIYFYGYRKPVHGSALSESFSEPLRAVVYFLAVLGSPLSGDHRYLTLPAAAVGLALVALFVWACRSFVRLSPDFAVTRRMIGWLMLGAYSVMTAVLLTFGRLGFGLQFSVTSRYKTFTLYLIVSLLHLAVISFEAGRSQALFGGKSYRRRVLITGVAAVAILYLFASMVAIRHAGMLRTSLLQAKAGMLFMNVIPNSYLKELTEERCPDLLAMRDTVNALDRLGFLRPALIKTDRVQYVGSPAAPAEGGYGAFEQLTRQEDLYIASGHALLPERNEPADAVLLAYENREGPIAFALVKTSHKGDIMERLGSRTGAGGSYWQVSFPASALPADAVKITAWAFDATTGKVIKLDGAHVIERS